MAFVTTHLAYLNDCAGEVLLEDIDWYRGDSFEISLIIKSCGEPVNLDEHTITLTVNSDNNPSDTVKQMFTIEGATASDQATNTGKVGLTIQTLDTAVESTGTYFYDLQDVDQSGNIRTIAKYRFILHQEITKSIPTGTPSVNPNGTTMLNPDGTGTVNP